MRVLEKWTKSGLFLLIALDLSAFDASAMEISNIDDRANLNWPVDNRSAAGQPTYRGYFESYDRWSLLKRKSIFVDYRHGIEIRGAQHLLVAESLANDTYNASELSAGWSGSLHKKLYSSVHGGVLTVGRKPLLLDMLTKADVGNHMIIGLSMSRLPLLTSIPLPKDHQDLLADKGEITFVWDQKVQWRSGINKVGDLSLGEDHQVIFRQELRRFNRTNHILLLDGGVQYTSNPKPSPYWDNPRRQVQGLLGLEVRQPIGTDITWTGNTQIEYLTREEFGQNSSTNLVNYQGQVDCLAQVDRVWLIFAGATLRQEGSRNPKHAQNRIWQLILGAYLWQ